MLKFRLKKLGTTCCRKDISLADQKPSSFVLPASKEGNLDLLERGLMTIAHSEDVKEVALLPHGTKYILEGLLQTPAGSAVQIQTVWVIDKQEDRPRFVTAYPV